MGRRAGRTDFHQMQRLCLGESYIKLKVEQLLGRQTVGRSVGPGFDLWYVRLKFKWRASASLSSREAASCVRIEKRALSSGSRLWGAPWLTNIQVYPAVLY